MTVTDLDVSEAFYTEVLDFVTVMEVGYGRILMHPKTGFSVAVIKHPQARGGSFTELTTGLDHLGLTASSPADLEEWQRRFVRHGVSYTPIRDMQMGWHLNFRDPDGIALEFYAPNDLALLASVTLAAGQLSQAEIATFVAEHVDPAYARSAAPSPR